MKSHKPRYAASIYDHELLKFKADLIAAFLPDLMHKLKADAVVVTGKSGISMGFAVLARVDFALVTVRKDGEGSHGRVVEGACPKLQRYIFLDDFISSGATARRVESALIAATDAQRETSSRYRNLQPPVCVGIIEYERTTNEGGSYFFDRQHSFVPLFNIMRKGLEHELQI